MALVLDKNRHSRYLWNVASEAKESLGGLWMLFATFQTCTILISLLTQNAFLPLLSLISLTTSAVFLPKKYSYFSCCYGILVAYWITSRVTNTTDLVLPIIETWLTGIGLTRYLLSKRIRWSPSFRRLILSFIPFLILQFVTFFRGQGGSWISLLGNILRFYTLCLLVYSVSTVLTKRDYRTFAVFLLTGPLFVGLTISFHVLQRSQMGLTLEAISLIRSSSLSDPNYALVATFMSCYAIGFLIKSQMKNEKHVLLPSLIVLFGLVLTLFSASRTAVLCALVGIFYTSVSEKNMFLPITLVFAFLVLEPRLPPAILERLTQKGAFQSARSLTMLNAWRYIQTNQIWGSGQDLYFKSTIGLGAHNTILHVWAEGGIFYLFSWFLPLYVFYDSQKCQPIHANKIFSIGILLIYFVASNGLTILHNAALTGLTFSMVTMIMVSLCSEETSADLPDPLAPYQHKAFGKATKATIW